MPFPPVVFRTLATSLVLAAGSWLSLGGAQAETLAVRGEWAAFKDRGGQRCYAISQAVQVRPARPILPAHAPYVAIAFGRGAGPSGFSTRLPATPAPGRAAQLNIGRARFILMVRGPSAWAQNAVMERAILAALRTARGMAIGTTDSNGQIHWAIYSLEGYARALDAAAFGCARN